MNYLNDESEGYEKMYIVFDTEFNKEKIYTLKQCIKRFNNLDITDAMRDLLLKEYKSRYGEHTNIPLFSYKINRSNKEKLVRYRQ